MTEIQADYALRGRDYETELVGPITDSIIDADRLVRLDHRNGFPNFAIYRLVLAGDRAYVKTVREWWVLFALEWCKSNCRERVSEDLIAHAAWDSLLRAMYPRAQHPSRTEIANAIDEDRDRFIWASKNLEEILTRAMFAYWEWLQVCYRTVVILERRC